MSLPSSLAEVSHNRSKCRPTNWNIIDFLHKKNICEKQLGYLWLIEESKASGLPAREMLPSACSQKKKKKIVSDLFMLQIVHEIGDAITNYMISMAYS